MRVHLRVVGRLPGRSEERALVDDYVSRFAAASKPLGWRFGGEHEVDDRKGGGPAGEAELLRKGLPKGGLVVCLDERGATLSSPDLAEKLRGWAGTGRPDVSFVIGGADGLAQDFVSEADFSLSLGAMVWPHKLVRVMMAEQLYRAATILTGSPYHRA